MIGLRHCVTRPWKLTPGPSPTSVCLSVCLSGLEYRSHYAVSERRPSEFLQESASPSKPFRTFSVKRITSLLLERWKRWKTLASQLWAKYLALLYWLCSFALEPRAFFSMLQCLELDFPLFFSEICLRFCASQWFDVAVSVCCWPESKAHNGTLRLIYRLSAERRLCWKSTPLRTESCWGHFVIATNGSCQYLFQFCTVFTSNAIGGLPFW